MDGPFDTPGDEAEHARPILRLVRDDADPETRVARAADRPIERVMSTELRLARNKALIRSLNERVAAISETLETFGSLKFMCECGIYACKERIELTVSQYEAVRLDRTHFLLHPNHVLHALEFVVLECPESYVVVEEVSAAARLATALAADQRSAVEEPVTRDTDARA
jgi:hypothetical protein